MLPHRLFTIHVPTSSFLSFIFCRVTSRASMAWKCSLNPLLEALIVCVNHSSNVRSLSVLGNRAITGVSSCLSVPWPLISAFVTPANVSISMIHDCNRLYIHETRLYIKIVCVTRANKTVNGYSRCHVGGCSKTYSHSSVMLFQSSVCKSWFVYTL